MCFYFLLIIILIIRTTTTDIKYGKIFNKDLFTILFFMLVGLLVFDRESLLRKNYYYYIFISIMLPYLLYNLNVWSAGDSKLISLLFMLTPFKLIELGSKNFLYFQISVITLLFTISLIYFFIETMTLSFKNKEKIRYYLFESKGFKVTFFKSFMIYFLVKGFNVILLDIFKLKIPILLGFSLNLILIYLVNRFIRIKYSKQRLLILLGLNTLLIFVNPSVKSLMFLACYILYKVISYLSSLFNYEEIETKQVKKGMILSRNTILKFIPSKVKGLPDYTTEKLDTRITQEHAESIKRWENSKFGEKKIEIVRVLPYAPFINFTYIFLLIIKYWSELF